MCLFFFLETHTHICVRVCFSKKKKKKIHVFDNDENEQYTLKMLILLNGQGKYLCIIVRIIYIVWKKRTMYILYTYELHPTKKRIMTYTRKLEKSQNIYIYIYIYKQLTSYNNITYFNNSIVIMREGKFELRMFLLETLISVNWATSDNILVPVYNICYKVLIFFFFFFWETIRSWIW